MPTLLHWFGSVLVCTSGFVVSVKVGAGTEVPDDTVSTDPEETVSWASAALVVRLSNEEDDSSPLRDLSLVFFLGGGLMDSESVTATEIVPAAESTLLLTLAFGENLKMRGENNSIEIFACWEMNFAECVVQFLKHKATGSGLVKTILRVLICCRSWMYDAFNVAKSRLMNFVRLILTKQVTVNGYDANKSI